VATEEDKTERARYNTETLSKTKRKGKRKKEKKDRVVTEEADSERGLDKIN